LSLLSCRLVLGEGQRCSQQREQNAAGKHSFRLAFINVQPLIP
jgi:hypothetical protein